MGWMNCRFCQKTCKHSNILDVIYTKGKKNVKVACDMKGKGPTQPGHSVNRADCRIAAEESHREALLFFLLLTCRNVHNELKG